MSRSLETTRGYQTIAYTLRLIPKQDLLEEIDKYIKKKKIESGFIVTCVGSLSVAMLRMAGVHGAVPLIKDLEIVSFVGTVSIHGSHLHLSVSDNKGEMTGGHALIGCIVRTTAEIVIGCIPEVRFVREIDDRTGYDELFIEESNLDSNTK